MKGDSSGFNYAEVASKVRTVTVMESPPPSNVVELAQVFKPVPSPVNPYAKEGPVPDDKVSPELYYLSFSKVFVIWRFWESCQRCAQSIAQGATQLPLDGDYTCPHTDKTGYKEVVDRGLRGDAVLTLKDTFNLADGTRCVHVEWLEADPVRKRDLEKMAAEKAKNRVWPPDVEGFMKSSK